MDSNGYNRSIFGSEDGTCYVLGVKTQTVRHEIFNGAYRQISKADGLWIAVAPEVHEQLHMDKTEGSQWNLLMKRGEALWLAEDWDRTVQDFVNRYGKNYI